MLTKRKIVNQGPVVKVFLFILFLLQLLDLMHTLHTRAATIYSSWAEEQQHLETSEKKIEANSRALWINCWCPLLQGKANTT